MEDERWSSVINSCSQMSTEGKSIEETLTYLRDHGLSKIESMKVLVAVHGISLSEAKRIVHNSQTWVDTLERDNHFHEQLEEAAEQWADDE